MKTLHIRTFAIALAATLTTSTATAGRAPCVPSVLEEPPDRPAAAAAPTVVSITI